MIKALKNKVRGLVYGAVMESLNKQSADPIKRVNNQVSQKMLMAQYRQIFHAGIPLPNFEDVGFRQFSENDEDGILLYIFSLIGSTNKKLVDIGAAIGGSNTANLIVNHGWSGLLFEGNETRASDMARFYDNTLDTRNYPPKVLSEWITRDNIDQLLSDNGMNASIDLLTIDIDGVDYYIWEAIQSISPRVVLVEYQCIWGPVKSMSVPYSADFKAGYIGRFGVYCGASLAAFVKLAKKKGYRLVGCNRYGYNAFFMRDDVGQGVFPTVEPEACFSHPFTLWAQQEFFPKIERKDWVEI